MPTYTDPQVTHDPAPGLTIPSTWGDVVNQDVQAAFNKPTACAYPSASLSLTSGVETAVGMNTERWDNAAIHDTVTNNSRFTIPTGWAGVWSMDVWGEWALNAAGRRFLRLKLNGATTIGIFHVPPTSAGYADFLGAKSWKFAAGDYVEVFAFQDSGGALNLQVCEFSITWQSIG